MTTTNEKNNIHFEHKQSAHCENGVVSNMLNFYGIKLSEPMVFGIGSGLFFSHMPFLKVGGIPVTSFRPLPGMIFKRLSKRLGIKFEKHRYSNPHKSMEALDKNLQNGIPTGMLVGVYHLTYFPDPYRFHFNAHNIIVFEKKDNTYIISDPIMEGYESLSYNELLKVRYARGLFAPKGHMYWPKFVPKEIDLKSAIKKGIAHTCKDMLTIPIPMFGVKGIRYLAKKVRSYPKKLSSRRAASYTGQIVRAQEEIGTGGAGFRYMYSAFIQEAAEIMQNEKLRELSFELTSIGDLWREFAIITGRIVKNRNTVDESYDKAADLLLVIADKEEIFFKELNKLNKSL
ncbi:MAG: BtrH N-terminal domain-containing protein [Bacteroidetes bacterium]|nr:BtrH N-terminal domain-containing protein [Bacteroidota bacterium]